MILLLAAPAGAMPLRSEVGVHDVVYERPTAASARISAITSTQRYPINDGSAATIAVSVTPQCAASCNAADPQQIASFVGTLIHSDEVSLLTVQLDTPFELGFDCGFGAQACYFSGQNKMVINGNDTVGDDGSSRELVIAHEYGHHVAQHRENPAPFPTAIDWGPEHWASYENVCQGKRAGKLFPGDEGTHYYEDPGEAFAEAFARNRFPDSAVEWSWLPALEPDAGSFQAIREDTLSPWQGRTSFMLTGRVPARGEGAAVETLRTPLDGTVSLRPSLRRHGYELALRSRAGRLLRSSRRGLGPLHQLDYTVCGQAKIRLVIRSTRPHPSTFKLRIQRP